jgi:hypothetical protein
LARELGQPEYKLFSINYLTLNVFRIKEFENPLRLDYIGWHNKNSQWNLSTTR